MLALAYALLADTEPYGALPVGHADARDASGSAARGRIRVAASLVERLRARDRDAYDDLLRNTFEPLVAIATSIVGSQDVAEDVVQDVMVWVWEQGDAWKPGAAPAAYLIGAVRHRALNVVRTRGVESRYADRARREADAGPPSAAADWRAETVELEAALQRALTKLTERQRTAFLLRMEQQLTVPDVAASLGIGVRAAEKLLSRTVRQLRDELRSVIGG